MRRLSLSEQGLDSKIEDTFKLNEINKDEYLDENHLGLLCSIRVHAHKSREVVVQSKDYFPGSRETDFQACRDFVI